MNNPYDYPLHPQDDDSAAPSPPQALQNVFIDDFSFTVDHPLASSSVDHQHHTPNLMTASLVADPPIKFEYSDVPILHPEIPIAQPPVHLEHMPPPAPTQPHAMHPAALGSPILVHSRADSPSRKRGRNISSYIPSDPDFHLKKLAYEAAERPFAEAAAKMKQIENDDSIPESKTSANAAPVEFTKETHRQIYGMTWLIVSCSPNVTSVVPRNKVYAKYVEDCAKYCLVPLSPAHLGKMVRTIYPNLTIRRLGLRGQSKYHYCGIKMVENSSQKDSLSSESPEEEPVQVPPQFLQLSKEFDIPQLRYVPKIFDMIDNSDIFRHMNHPVNLPSIYPYLSDEEDYDVDIVDTLYSLYKIHCTNIFESLRYMKIDRLFDAFGRFSSILTAPVFKLYTSEPISAWVSVCDRMAYKMMIKMISKLHKQNIPKDVYHSLERISLKYTDNLTQSLTNKLPPAVISVTVRASQIFIRCLRRLLRVIKLNEQISVLSDSQNTDDIIQALQSVNIPEIVYIRAPFTRDNSRRLVEVVDGGLLSLLSEEFSLDRYLQFVGSMPEKVPVSANLLSITITNVFSEVFNQMLMNKERQDVLQNFWNLKCWISEVLYLELELGGIFYGEAKQKQQTQEQQEPPVVASEAPAREQQHEEPAYDDSSFLHQASDHNDSSIVDLLDGAYGQGVENFLNYESIDLDYLSQ